MAENKVQVKNLKVVYEEQHKKTDNQLFDKKKTNGKYKENYCKFSEYLVKYE